MKKLLQIFHEATARRGKRTGGFDIDPSDIENVFRAVLLGMKKYMHGGEMGRCGMVKLRDPVEGGDISIPVYSSEKSNPWDESAGYFWADVPDEGEKEKTPRAIGFNPKKLLDEMMLPPFVGDAGRYAVHLRRVVAHELAHIFDPSIPYSKYMSGKKMPSPSEDEAGYNIVYYNDPAEKRAHFQELVEEMLAFRKRGGKPKSLEDYLSRSRAWSDFGQAMGNKTAWMRKLQKAFFDIFYAD